GRSHGQTDGGGEPDGPLVWELLLGAPALSDDGRLLAYARADYGVLHHQPLVFLHDRRTDKPLLPPIAIPKFIVSLAFSGDAKTLAWCGVGGAYLLDVATGRTRAVLAENSTGHDAVFSPDGSRVAVVCRSGWPGRGPGLHVWDARTGEERGDFLPGE